MINMDIKELKSLLETSKKIVVIPHKNPDGDAIGSCVAINEVLKSLGHKSLIISPNNFPEFLKWIDDENDEALEIRDRCVEARYKTSIINFQAHIRRRQATIRVIRKLHLTGSLH